MKSPPDTQLKQLLVKQTGLDRALLDRPTWDAFVRRRCAELQLDDVGAYYQRVARNPAEIERIVQDIAVSETWLFRYPASYELLIKFAAKRLREGRNRLRMLSVACATGEEPLSMAMAAVEAGWPLDHLVLDAVDRHEDSLAIAREGEYPSRSLRDDVPAWAESWLPRDKHGVRVDRRIVDAVNFDCADILQVALPADSLPYDVVFCRNLFIYLGSAARVRLAERLARVMAPDGMLFVGHAEHIAELHGRFEKVDAPHAFAYQHRHPLLEERSHPVAAVRPVRSQPRGPQRPRSTVRTAASSAVERRRPPAAVRPKTCTVPTIDTARTLADNGQLSEALTIVEANIAAGCRDAEAFAMLGRIQLGLQRLPEARDAFGKVVYLEPHHEEALLQLAGLHEREGDAAAAKRFRRRAARAHQQQLDRDQTETTGRPKQPK
ncbi:MAG: hypothetical protein OES79_02110 [Planctomycetota bacterium]|nr:hypothetical protein [Planctomycetota bacterium]